MYVRVENAEVTQYPYGADVLRRENPHVSFPRHLTDEMLAEFGVHRVRPTPRPSHDPLTERVVEEAPVFQQARNPDGTFKSDDPGTPDNEAWEWVQAWSVVPLSTEEAAARLQSAKQQLTRRINSKRDELEAGGFDYLGKRLDSDERSVLRFNVAVQAAQAAAAAQQPFEIDWTCADNSTLTMGLVEMLSLPVAFAQFGNALHQHARGLKEAVAAAQTSADFAAIDIEAGWPS